MSGRELRHRADCLQGVYSLMTDPTISPHEPPHIFALLKLFEAVSDEKAERNILEVSLPDLREAAARIRELEAEVGRQSALVSEGANTNTALYVENERLRAEKEKLREALLDAVRRLMAVGDIFGASKANAALNSTGTALATAECDGGEK